MKKAYSIHERGLAAVLSLLMVMSLCVFTLSETGCGKNSQTTEQKVQSVISKINAYAPTLQPLAISVAALANDPSIIAVIGTVQNDANLLLKPFSDALAAYNANPSPANWSKFTSAVDAIMKDFNTKLLAAVGIKNAENQRLAIGALGALDTAFHLIDGWILSAQTATVARLHAQSHETRLATVLPYLNKPMLDQAAHAEGLKDWKQLADVGYSIGL